MLYTKVRDYYYSISKSAHDLKPIINEQIDLYNKFENTIKKVGIKDMNKKCKGLSTKEDLETLLETLK